MCASEMNGRNNTVKTATGARSGESMIDGANAEPPSPVRLSTSESVELTPSLVSIPDSWRKRSVRTTSTAAKMATATIVAPLTMGVSSRSSTRLLRVMSAAANATPMSAAMCGRSIPASHNPRPQARSPRQTSCARIFATPYAASPRPNIIHASLPMPDGQNTSEGMKNNR